MNKNIAIVVALVIVLGAFLGSAFKANDDAGAAKRLESLPESFSLGLVKPTLAIPSLGETSVAIEAWAVFRDYLKFAKAHDLESLKSISHQLSLACSNPDRAEECYSLMDNVYNVAKGFKQNEFKNVAYDDKQVILSTDYNEIDETSGPAKAVLYFTRDAKGKPKILGLRFCYGNESGAGAKCIETDPAKRDLDQNGWWDDVEALFYK